MTETGHGHMLRIYAEMSEREVKALVIESQCRTAEALAHMLAEQIAESQS